jgi:hypothetical protein
MSVVHKEAPVRQKGHHTRTGYLVGTDTVGVLLHAYPQCTRYSQKKKKKFWYELGTSPVGLGTGGTKTKPNGVVLGLNSNPISLLHPILSHSILSLTSSLHHRCTWFSLSHFLTLPATEWKGQLWI